jgi:hypothetical protein
MAIQWSNQKLWPFQTGILVRHDEPSAWPSSDSTSTTRNTVSENSYKNLSAIQRSDQKLWPFRTGTLVWRVENSTSPSSDSTSTPRKTVSINSSKIWGRSNGRIKSYCPFEPVLWSGASTPPPPRVAIPHLLQGKQRPETPVKIWVRSKGRIKSYSPFKPVF